MAKHKLIDEYAQGMQAAVRLIRKGLAYGLGIEAAIKCVEETADEYRAVKEDNRHE